MAWPADLSGFGQLSACRAHFAVPDAVWNAFVTTAGDPGEDIRLLAALPPAVMARSAETATLASGDGLTAIQAAQLGCVYRLARRKVHVDSGLPLEQWVDPDPWNAAPLTPTPVTPVAAASTTPERKMKYTTVLDQGDESEFQVLPESQKAMWLMDYVNKTGGMPQEQEEPTLEQLSALQRRIQSGGGVYADFGVWLPFGKKAHRAYKYRTYIPQGDGTFLMREVPGPSSMSQWMSSYRVYKVALIMLDVVTMATLQVYEAQMEKLVRIYGEGCWHLIVAADDLARSERMQRLRVQTKLDILNGGRPPQKWNEDSPWEALFLMVAKDKEFWSDQVHIPANAWLAHGSKGVPRTPAEAIANTTMKGGQDTLQPETEPAGGLSSPTARGRNARRTETRKRKLRADREELAKFREKDKGKKDGDPQKGKGKGKPQLCYAWNNNNGACAGLPPGSACQGKVAREHRCTKCGSPGHPSHQCTKQS